MLPTHKNVTHDNPSVFKPRVFLTCDKHKVTNATPEDFSCCDVCKEDTDFIDMHPKTCIDCYARMCHSHGDDLMGDEKYYRCDGCTAKIQPFENFKKTVANIKKDISPGQVIVASFRLSPTMITTYEFTCTGPNTGQAKMSVDGNILNRITIMK
jgi:hypothetical protein